MKQRKRTSRPFIKGRLRDESSGRRGRHAESHRLRVLSISMLVVIVFAFALFGSILLRHNLATRAITAASSTPDHHRWQHHHRQPAVPMGLRAAAASYAVYRNGTQIGTSTTPSFADKKVRPKATYSYQISASAASGQLSAQSTAAVVTTSAAVASPAPTPSSASPSASASPVSAPSGFPNASNTGYENAPGYPGQLTNCSGNIKSNTTYRYCNFPGGLAIGSANSHPTNVTFIGCRFASNAVADANVADYGSNIVFSYSTFEPSTAAAGAGPTSPYASPLANGPGYQYGIDQRSAGALTVENADFWGFAQAIEFGNSSQPAPLVVTNSWIHNPRAPGGVDHTDGILENYGGVSYMMFNHNSIVGDGNTNALALQGSSPYNHVTITNNYFSGYGYMVNSGSDTRSTNMVFTGNVWGTDFKPAWGPLYGGAMYNTPGLGGVWANNKIEVQSGTTWMAAGNNGLYWWPNDSLPGSSSQIIGHHQDYPGA